MSKKIAIIALVVIVFLAAGVTATYIARRQAGKEMKRQEGVATIPEKEITQPEESTTILAFSEEKITGPGSFNFTIILSNATLTGSISCDHDVTILPSGPPLTLSESKQKIPALITIPPSISLYREPETTITCSAPTSGGDLPFSIEIALETPMGKSFIPSSPSQEQKPAKPCTVTLQFGQSIQKAISQVQKNDVVCLAEGTWNENLVIEKSLTLQGSGPEKSIIKSTKKNQPVVLIKGKEIEVTLEKLQLTGAFPDPSVLEWRDSGVWIEGSSKVNIINSRISGNGSGLDADDFVQVTITNSTISDNENIGLEVGGSAMVIITSSIVSNNRWGLRLGDSAKITITNSTISNNRVSGVTAGAFAEATITNSTLSKNGEAGIELEGMSPKLSVKESLIEGNGTELKCHNGEQCHGLSLWAYKPQVELFQTTIRNNTDWGIAALLKKCGYELDFFSGEVIWEGRENQIYGNGKGEICLP